jgi:hypothetical protein
MYKKLPFQKKDFPLPKDLKRHQNVFKKPTNQLLQQLRFDEFNSNREEIKNDRIDRNKN